MKLLLICLFLSFYTCTASSALRGVKTYEFGVNIGSIVFTTSGSMYRYEKVKTVPVRVPDCSVLQYVRVDVNNPLTSPTVKFHWDTNNVIIEYAPYEYSASQYTVVAKAVKMFPCQAVGDIPADESKSAPLEHEAST